MSHPFLILSLMLTCDLVRTEKNRRVKHIDSVSMSLTTGSHPLFLCFYQSNCPLHGSLSCYPLLCFPSPVCSHNNPSVRRPGNKLGPSFLLHTSPSVRTKPIKDRLNYSCWIPPTPGYNTMGHQGRPGVGEVWWDVWRGLQNKYRGWNRTVTTSRLLFRPHSADKKF